MMLTHEQRDELKAAAYGRGFVHDGLLRAVLAHVDAQQARIAELEEGRVVLIATHQKIEAAYAAHVEKLATHITELEKDAARLDFIERMAKQSRTGVGIDWVRHVEDGFVTDHGYRVMWHHTLNDRKRDMRSAIDTAMQSTLSEDASDYGSRIAVIGQNGATGEHYDEERNP